MDLVGDAPVIVPRAVKADYQESQTIWKSRMEKEDEKWTSKRDEIKEAKVKALGINFSAACSICSNVNGQTFVRCETCRYHLCTKCDKSLHSTQITHQRKCEINGCIHRLLPTEFLTFEGILETLSTKFINIEVNCLGY